MTLRIQLATIILMALETVAFLFVGLPDYAFITCIGALAVMFTL